MPGIPPNFNPRAFFAKLDLDKSGSIGYDEIGKVANQTKTRLNSNVLRPEQQQLDHYESKLLTEMMQDMEKRTRAIDTTPDGELNESEQKNAIRHLETKIKESGKSNAAPASQPANNTPANAPAPAAPGKSETLENNVTKFSSSFSPEEMMKRFDSNGDKKLDKQEIAKAGMDLYNNYASQNINGTKTAKDLKQEMADINILGTMLGGGKDEKGLFPDRDNNGIDLAELKDFAGGDGNKNSISTADFANAFPDRAGEPKKPSNRTMKDLFTEFLNGPEKAEDKGPQTTEGNNTSKPGAPTSYKEATTKRTPDQIKSEITADGKYQIQFGDNLTKIAKALQAHPSYNGKGNLEEDIAALVKANGEENGVTDKNNIRAGKKPLDVSVLLKGK